MLRHMATLPLHRAQRIRTKRLARLSLEVKGTTIWLCAIAVHLLAQFAQTV